jgi:DNA mismatch repair protein MutS
MMLRRRLCSRPPQWWSQKRAQKGPLGLLFPPLQNKLPIGRRRVSSSPRDPLQNAPAEPHRLNKTSGTATPAMKQYLALKKDHPEFLLLFRMGDFFELFFSDAERASQFLGIQLTARHGVPMCGIPARAVELYISKLVNGGFLVAVCDQVETSQERDSRIVSEGPKKASHKLRSKRLIQRAVTRLVTPGTLTEDRFLQPRKNNFLLAISKRQLEQDSSESSESFGLAWVDLSTGEFRVATRQFSELPAELARIAPSEVVISSQLLQKSQSNLQETQTSGAESGSPLASLLSSFHVTLRDDRVPEQEVATRVAELASANSSIGGGVTDSTVAAAETPTSLELDATAVLLRYLDVTQMGRDTHLESPQRVGDTGSGADATMLIDPASQKALELARTVNGDKVGSLLWVMDETVTAGGARLLGEHLGAPLVDTTAIEARLDAVGWFVTLSQGSPVEQQLFQDIRATLKGCFDLTRCTQRVLLGRGTPKDLSDVASTLMQLPILERLLVESTHAPLPALLQEHAGHLRCPSHAVLMQALRSIADDPPTSTADGGVIAPGVSPELDELRRIRDDTRGVLDELQARYRDATGIRALRIKRNLILGYHFELSVAQRAKIEPFLATDTGTTARNKDNSTAPPAFVIYQSTQSALKLKTQELIDLELKLTTAHSEAVALEQRMFQDLCAKVCDNGTSIRSAAHALAAIDVASSHAFLAIKRDYVRPEFLPSTDDPQALRVTGGRHAILEVLRGNAGDPLVANDCLLGGSDEAPRFVVLTGPNMGGKSTCASGQLLPLPRPSL